MNTRLYLPRLLPAALLLAGCAAVPPAGAAPNGVELPPAPTRAGAPTSKLWGRNGEAFDPLGRLPDFSFAGYRSGEKPIPNPPVKINVRDLGAKGDGESDDTGAFLEAIRRVENGAVLIPAGRYKLTQILYIRKSNVVLRGEGTGKTTLFYPKGLEQIEPKSSATSTGDPTTAYSWSGGLIWIQGKQEGREVGAVGARAARGSRAIEIEGAPRVLVAPGESVEITQEDSEDRSLISHLYGGQPGNTSKVRTPRATFVSRVVAVDGSKLTLERALRTDVEPRWKARVKLFAPSVTEVGVENLSFEFPSVPYRGHFKEDGFNPIAIGGASHCWGRNLRLFNADSGPFLNGSSFNTFENIVYEADRPADKAGNTGHHGFTIGGDNLLRGFDFRTKFVHDISVEGHAGGVASGGKMADGSFDNHKRHPYANLFSDIDIGEGRRMYASGGGADLGRHAGAWTTFWNIRAKRPQAPPTSAFAPDLTNFVGVTTEAPAQTEANGKWFEPLASVEPRDLYTAQLARRLKAGKER